MTKPPFVVLALPRSRTKWLAEFLSYNPWICGHDQLQYCQSLDDVATWFTQPNIGSVETAAAPFWRLLRKMQPDARIVTVRRPVGEVLDSLARHGIGGDTVEGMIRACDRKLDQIEARVPGVLSVQYEDLRKTRACRAVFEHCLQQPFDQKWWHANDYVVSGNLKAQTRYAHAHLPRFLKLARTARQRMLADLSPPTAPPEGFTIQEEDIDTWFRDAKPLIRDHMVATGQDVDEYKTKNEPMLRRISACGFVQIVTARSNGRMFGYQMTVLGPSLDKIDRLEAMHLPFFVSRDAPHGIGVRLQRAAIDGLRAKGVGELFARAGVRGSGPKLGILWRRLGFEDFGTMHRLDLTESVS